MANEVFEAIRTVLAVREYDDREVPEDVLLRVVEAGRLTASASNRQPWHFVLVRQREALSQLGSLLQTGPYTSQAPAAIVVAFERENKLGVSDASRAIQSMILTAWADGVASNWVGFAGRLEEVRKLVGLPDTFEVVAVLPLGYPKRQIGKGQKNRKPLAEVASAERFGEPLRS